MINRPFVITQPIPALSQDGTVTLHHENDGIILAANHPFLGEFEGMLLDIDVAEQVRDALDTLIDEARRGHIYAQESL